MSFPLQCVAESVLWLPGSHTTCMTSTVRYCFWVSFFFGVFYGFLSTDITRLHPFQNVRYEVGKELRN